MQITIKNFEKKETEQLKQLLSLCHEEENLLDLINGSNLKFAYSAFYGSKLIGIVFAWTSSFHPNCTYFRILSDPFYKRMKIDEVLLAELEEKYTDNSPLQTSLWETSINLTEMYRNSGFKEIRKTYMPKLKVAEVIEHAHDISEKYSLITLAQALSNESLMKKLTYLVKKNYEETHLANPIKELEIQEWEKMILAGDTLLNGSYIYIDEVEEDIVAYAFLHESDSKESYELGWCGAANIGNKKLIPDLTIHQAKYASDQGVQFIIGEFDNTDAYAMEVLKNLPFTPCPAWITYQIELSQSS